MPTKNIYAKLAEAKTEIGKFARDKKNEFIGFSYTELDTILSKANEVCLEKKLLFIIGNFEINKKKSELGALVYTIKATLFDIEKPEDKIEYLFDFPADKEGKKMKLIQAAGSSMTYSTRYIYGCVFSLQFADDADSDKTSGGDTKNENDFGTPKHPFSRENIIEFGGHGKGKGKEKKWLDLTDEYLKILNTNVVGGYRKFIEKELAFRANDKKLEKGKGENAKKNEPLPNGIVIPSDFGELKDLAKEKGFKNAEKKGWSTEAMTAYLEVWKPEAEKPKAEPKKEENVEKPLEEKKAEEKPETEAKTTEKPSKAEDEIEKKFRTEIIGKIEFMRKKGHMGAESAKAWTGKAETLNDPIKFHVFYLKVVTGTLVCEASDANKIDKDTKIAYFDVVKGKKTTTDDLKSIIEDMKTLLAEATL